MIGIGKASPAPDGGASTCRFLRLDEIGAEVRGAVAETGYPARSEVLETALKERAIARVTAGEALPIDRSASHSDGWLLDDVEHCRTAVRVAYSDAKTAGRLVDGAFAKVAALPRPMGVLEWLSTVALFLLVLAAGVPALAGHLAPSIDAFILRRYVTSILHGEAELFSAQVSFLLAAVTAALLLGGPILLVLRARGEVDRTLKVGIILAECIVAGAYAAMRLGGTFSWQALSVSIIEIGVSLLTTVVALGVGSVLRKDASKVEPYRIAKAELNVARMSEKRTERVLLQSKAELTEVERSVASREDGVRRGEANSRLASATALADYYVAVAKLVGETARVPAEDVAADQIEEHLASEFDREEKRRAAHGRR